MRDNRGEANIKDILICTGIVLGLLLIIYIFVPKCAYSGCNEMVDNKGDYCKKHVCKVYYCDDPPEKEGFCSYHYILNKAEEILKKPTKHNNSNQSNNNYKPNIPSSSNKKEWPNCDDYNSFDDFMDDWDGNMPDGSDAEEYWDNW